jgi:hypothetical protein
VDEAEQDVLGADVVVVEEPRLFLGQNHDPPGTVGKAFEQETASWTVSSVVSLPGRRREETGSATGRFLLNGLKYKRIPWWRIVRG